MHVIVGHVSNWQVPILKLLRYFKLNVYYIYISANTDSKKNKIATKLKKNNIFPLPIELENKILSNAGFAISFLDPDELSYKKNIQLVPEKIIKKYSSLFSVDEKNTKKIRLLIQDFISTRHMYISSHLDIWSAIYSKKKIIYLSFNFKCFYLTDIGHNVYKIIIPLNLLNYFFKSVNFKKILLLFSSIKNGKNVGYKKQDIKNPEKKSVAFIVHKGLTFGRPTLFEKSLYYSDDKNSCLNKHNILHIDYENFLSPDAKLHWICLNKTKVPVVKIFLKTLLASIKTIYLVRGWSTFLGWLLCINKYSIYIKYCETIKQFKNLKIAIIDYDILCPKTLILALEKNKIKTVATQERFIHTFCTSFANVILDTYYVTSEFAADFIKNSKYHDIKNLIPIGSYRSDYLSSFRKAIIPEEISKAKDNGKKIIIVLGYHPPNNWFESYTSLETNWSSQMSFLEDLIRLSQILKNTFIVIRYKTLDWMTNEYFKQILKRINNCENITISTSYESFYAYKLCTHADLVIAKHTSLADECLANEIPVLFYEYGHNLTKIMSDVFNYLSSGLMCYNFEELLERSNSLLFNNSSKLKNKITELNRKIYYVKEKGNVKNKIINSLENLIGTI